MSEHHVPIDQALRRQFEAAVVAPSPEFTSQLLEAIGPEQSVRFFSASRLNWLPLTVVAVCFLAAILTRLDPSAPLTAWTEIGRYFTSTTGVVAAFAAFLILAFVLIEDRLESKLGR
jgi:hypothetical protein